MNDRIYIFKSDVLDLITEAYEADGFKEYSAYSSLWDSIDDMPAADVMPKSGIEALQEQISSIKRNVKSENIDYLSGYISALSAVEGMIAEMDGGVDND